MEKVCPLWRMTENPSWSSSDGEEFEPRRHRQQRRKFLNPSVNEFIYTVFLIFFQLMDVLGARACFPQWVSPAPLIFCLNSVAVALHGAFIRTKSSQIVTPHLAESFFQIRPGE